MWYNTKKNQKSLDLAENSCITTIPKRNSPPSPEHSNKRKLHRQVKRSVCADREAWWTKKTGEMETANNSGNIRRLFQLIRSTGPRRPTVSETIKDHQGVLISKKERLDRRADHFEEQFNWPAAAVSPGAQSMTEPWTVKLDPLRLGST